MYQLAGRGLVAAHEAGLVHRDFKGDNVLVGDDGRVRVTDFGLVAAMGAGESGDLTKTEQALRKESELAVSLTQTGAVMGTPRYMAPEQHLGQPLDARADQFAFCVALYEALYKQPPFAGESYQVLMCNVLAGELVPAPEGSDVPPSIRKAVLGGLARQRDDRHPSMRALLEALALDATPQVASMSKRRWWLIAAGGVAFAATIAAGVVYAVRPGDEPVEPRPWATASERAARALFADGNLQLSVGQYVKAADIYRKALKDWDHPAIHYNLALALLNLDEPVEVFDNLTASLKYGAEALGKDKFEQAKEYLTLIQNQIADIEVSCNTPGAAISVDGKKVVIAPDKFSGKVKVGKHTFVCEKAGFIARVNAPFISGQEHLRVVLDELAPTTAP